MFTAAIAERKQARGGGAEIDDHEKERRKRIDAEMRTEPGQTEWQRRRRRLGATDKLPERGETSDGTDQKRAAIHYHRAQSGPADRKREDCKGEKSPHRGQDDNEGHRGVKAWTARRGPRLG